MKVFICTLIFTLFCAMPIFSDNNEQSPQSQNKMLGYTKKFTLPAKGLTDEERKYIAVASQINDVLSEEVDFQIIMNRIVPVLNPVWDNMINAQILVHISSGQSPNRDKHVKEIFIERPDKGKFRFSVGGPNSITPNQEKLLRAIEVVFADGRPEVFCVYFYPNGNVSRIAYIKKLSKIKREVTWSETGELLNERTITKPEPLKIVK